MKLIFENRKFILLNVSQDVSPTHKSWVRNHANNSYQTKDIDAAAQFRMNADDKTEKIFKKYLSKAYTLPFASGGAICPKHLSLFDYQKNQGIPHVLSGNRKYLAHDPGLGKSAQAICAVNSKPGKTLIICPAFLKLTWAREITKWSIVDFPEIQIVPESNQRLLMNWNCDFIIVSDSMLAKPWVFEKLFKAQFKFIFVDEAHRYKNPLASRTAALFGGQVVSKINPFKSPGLIFSAEHVCLLSGTPVVASAIDLWPIIFGMLPGLINFMTYNEFGYTFCYTNDVGAKGEIKFKGARNTEQLRSLIMPNFMQRIKKEMVLKDLPDKIRSYVYISGAGYTGEQFSLEGFAEMIENNGGELPDGLGMFAKLRHDIGVYKIDFAAAYITNLLNENLAESIIVFAYHRDVVEALEKRLAPYNPSVINGGVTLEARTRIEDNFQNGINRLIIGNIDAMNLGLTLTEATRIVFVEYSWTPAANEQAEDRAHRIGQKDAVYIEYLVLTESLDEMVIDVLHQKKEAINRLIEGQ